MSALLLTLTIFIFWGVVGFAAISVSNTRLRVLQSVLISPSVGIAVSVLPVFFINRAGMPVKDFGVWLIVILFAFSILAIAVKRPIFPTKHIFPYAAILIVALLLAAHPMLRYGFDWVSFSNDDMANYTLAAQRFLNHGFFDEPNLEVLRAGKDYSLAYWFMHVGAGVRSGSELMLATIWRVSGLNAHQIFMPVIMALHLALVAAVGAMVAGTIQAKRASIIAIGLMAVSPLTTLGALYQLIGQVGGLALLTSAVTLMCRPFPSKSFASVAVGSVPALIIVIALFIWYPEVLPFFGLSWILYASIFFKRKRIDVLKVIIPAFFVGVLALLVLNKYMITALIFMFGQASGGMQSADLTTILFPYFLVPSGIAAFWGLIPIGEQIHEPFLSIAIGGGILLFYILLRRIIPNQIDKISVPVSMLVLMTVMGMLLFFRNNDFGIFKLAMFAQPFLLGVIAIELSKYRWRDVSFIPKICSIALLLPLGFAQLGYVGKSTGEIFGGLNEIPRASSQKINQQFQDFFDSIRGKNINGYVADTSNVVLAKFQSMYTQGESLIFPSRGFFSAIQRMALTGGLSAFANAESYTSRFADLDGNEYFEERQIDTDSGENKFLMPKGGSENITKRMLLTTIEKQTIFNGASFNLGHGYFQYVLEPRNHLIFIHSSLGNHYYLGDRKKTAFYQLEDDPMFPGQRFSSLGQHLLFMIMGVTEGPRIIIEMTDTVVKQFGSELPKPKIQNTITNFIGRGSGRVFSAPIIPTYIDGMPFVSIDMGRKAEQFPKSKKGLMILYGRDIPVDHRRITAFGRDISLISEQQYQAIQPPGALKSFPADLANKNLEYSGIYEDGWISEKSFFVLSPSSNSKFIAVTGSVPQIADPNFSTVLKVSLNGKEIGSQRLGLGSFEFKLPITSLVPRQRIELEFSTYQTLPGADGRIAPAKINFIGFE